MTFVQSFAFNAVCTLSFNFTRWDYSAAGIVTALHPAPAPLEHSEKKLPYSRYVYFHRGKSLGAIMHQQTFDVYIYIYISIQRDNADYSCVLSVLTRASTKERSANNTFQRNSTEREFQVVIFEFQVWIRMYSLNGKATAELLDRVSISENSIVKEIASRKMAICNRKQKK